MKMCVNRQQLRAPATAAQQLGEASRRSRCADAAIHPCSLLVAAGAAATAGPPAPVVLMGSQRARRGELQLKLLSPPLADVRGRARCFLSPHHHTTRRAPDAKPSHARTHSVLQGNIRAIFKIKFNI